MLPLNNELESCKKLIEHIKLSYTRDLRGNAFVGDDFMALRFFNRVVSMISIGRHVGQNYSLLISC